MSFFQKFSLPFLVLGSISVLVGLHAGGLFPRARAGDVAQLIGAPMTTLEGQVGAFPSTRWSKTRFLFEGHALPPAIFQGRALVTLDFPVYDLAPGDRIRVRGYLSAPRPAPAPGRFNERSWAAAQGAYAKLRVWEASGFQRLFRPRWSLARTGWNFRNAFAEFWRDRLPPREAALLLGFTVGVSETISSELKEQCIRAGIYHLVVVSGLHVSLLAAWMLRLFRWLRLPAGYSLFPALAAILFFASVAGPSAPVLRAVFMTLTALVAFQGARDGPRLYPLLIAAGLLTAHQPEAIFGASFQLSFISTASLLIGLPPLERHTRTWPRWLAWILLPLGVTLAVQIGTGPFLAHYFGRLSVTGLAANAVLVPLSGLLLAPGLALGTLGVLSPGAVPEFCIEGMSLLLRTALTLIEGFARPAWAVVEIPDPGPRGAALYYLGVFGILWAVRTLHENHRPRF